MHILQLKSFVFQNYRCLQYVRFQERRRLKMYGPCLFQLLKFKSIKLKKLILEYKRVKVGLKQYVISKHDRSNRDIKLQSVILEHHCAKEVTPVKPVLKRSSTAKHDNKDSKLVDRLEDHKESADASAKPCIDPATSFLDEPCLFLIEMLRSCALHIIRTPTFYPIRIGLLGLESLTKSNCDLQGVQLSQKIVDSGNSKQERPSLLCVSITIKQKAFY